MTNESKLFFRLMFPRAVLPMKNNLLWGKSAVNMSLDTEDAAHLWGNGSSQPLLNGTSAYANNSNVTWRNSSELVPLDLARAVPLGIVLGAFIVFAIVGNILVILSVVCNRHLRTPTNYFIVNLAIADLLLGTTVLPVSATLEILNYWVLGKIFCDIWAALDVLCCTASIISLCVISIDRYIGVSYPLQYPSIVTVKRALLAMLGVWGLSLVISIGPLLGWKQEPPPDDTVCFITEEPFYALFSSLGSFYIPLVVILAMYCQVYIVAKRTTKNLEDGVMRERMNSNEMTLRIHKGSHMHEVGGSAGKGRGHHARSSLSVKLLKFSREKKAAKTLGVVVGMFTLCWLPFFLVLPIGSFNVSLRPPDTLYKVIFWLGYFNSCLNPIIYPCYSRAFKLAFIRILRCHWRGRKRPRFRAYDGCGSNPGSCGSRWRKESADQASSGWPNGSQRTLSSASPSPSCLSGASRFALELEPHQGAGCAPRLPLPGGGGPESRPGPRTSGADLRDAGGEERCGANCAGDGGEGNGNGAVETAARGVTRGNPESSSSGSPLKLQASVSGITSVTEVNVGEQLVSLISPTDRQT